MLTSFSIEHVPVVMADLVTEMAEQGAVGLAHGVAAPLAFRVVRFGDVDGDQAVVVTGQDVRGVRSRLVRVGKKLEGQSARVLGPRGDGQP